MAANVDQPDVAGVARKAALARGAAALGEANSRLTATRQCQQGQRQRAAGDR